MEPCNGILYCSILNCLIRLPEGTLVVVSKVFFFHVKFPKFTAWMCIPLRDWMITPTPGMPQRVAEKMVIPTVCGCEMLGLQGHTCRSRQNRTPCRWRTLGRRIFCSVCSFSWTKFPTKRLWRAEIQKMRKFVYTEDKRIDIPFETTIKRLQYVVSKQKGIEMNCIQIISHVRTNIICPKFGYSTPKVLKIQWFSRRFPMSISMTCGYSVFLDKRENDNSQIQ